MFYVLILLIVEHHYTFVDLFGLPPQMNLKLNVTQRKLEFMIFELWNNGVIESFERKDLMKRVSR